jgi:hypothetical protein
MKLRRFGKNKGQERYVNQDVRIGKPQVEIA